MNKKTIVTICLIIAAVFLYWVASQFIETALGWFDIPVTAISSMRGGLDKNSLLYVQLPSLLIALAAFIGVYKSEKAFGFFLEATGELMKVTYPLPKQAAQSAVVVVVIVFVATMLLAVYDSVWSVATQWVLSV